jgi:uncharacterized protein DUF3618
MTADNPADQTDQPAKGRRTATDIPDDPQELAEDIKQTRDQVGQTVEALTNKLDPKVQLQETKAQLRETAGRMKGRVSAEPTSKITDKAGTVGQQVRGTAAKAARGADEQRVPLAVVAGVAVLLAGAWITWVMRRR